MPSSVAAEPQSTGVMVPLWTPSWMPLRISSRVNCSPEKYFSNSSSSVSATASLMAAVRPSQPVARCRASRTSEGSPLALYW